MVAIFFTMTILKSKDTQKNERNMQNYKLSFGKEKDLHRLPKQTK